MTYNVAIPAGTRVQLSLEDATGDEAWSGNVNFSSFVLGPNRVAHSTIFIDHRGRQR